MFRKADMDLGKLASIMLILLVVVLIIVAFSGKLYKVVGPVLGLEIDKLTHDKSIGSIDGVVKLYNSCKESKSTECVCAGDKEIKIDSTDRLIIRKGEIAESIRIEVESIGPKIEKSRIIGGISFCGYPPIELYAGENGGYDSRKEIRLYQYDSNSKVKIEQDSLIAGELNNPLVLYKTKQQGLEYLCLVTGSGYLQKLPKNSCV